MTNAPGGRRSRCLVAVARVVALRVRDLVCLGWPGGLGWKGGGRGVRVTAALGQGTGWYQALLGLVVVVVVEQVRFAT